MQDCLFNRKKMNLKYLNIILTLIILITSCNKIKKSDNLESGEPTKVDAIQEINETNEVFLADTFLINCDSFFEKEGYYIQLIKTDNNTTTTNNTLFTFGINKEQGMQTIYFDSIYSQFGEVEFRDFNNDGISDILIQNISDARSNLTYNLYIVDIVNNTLTKVEDFNKIKGPILNNELEIIESYVSSGTDYYEFYQIISNSSVVSYDLLIYDRHDENSEEDYNEAIEAIKNKSR